MTTIANPNALAIVAAFIAMSGVGFLARAALMAAPQGASEEQRRVADNRKAFNTALGVPVLLFGFMLQAMSQLVSAPPSAAMTIAMLALAFGLLLYGCLEDTLAEGVSTSAMVRMPTPKLHLLPPAAPQQEPREILIAAAPRPLEVTVAS